MLTRVTLLLVLALAPVTAPIARSQTATASAPAAAGLTLDAKEQFLKKARIVREHGVKKGVTGTVRATMRDGEMEHDASIQTIDEFKRIFQSAQGTEMDFRDSYRYNVGAYHVSRLLELEMIPATVERSFRGKSASYTWWVDDVLMDEGERLKGKHVSPDLAQWNQQMWAVRVFDQLIANVDRNLGNLLIDKNWRVWMIDHSRAFRRTAELKSPGNLTRCDRGLLQRLKALDKPGVKNAVGDTLADWEIEAMLKRRDLIVEHFEKAGAAALYDLKLPSLP